MPHQPNRAVLPFPWPRALLPQPMPGLVNEDVLQRRLRDADGVDLAGEGLHQLRDELVAALAFNAHRAVDHGGGETEALLDLLAKRLRVAGTEDDHVAADALLELLRGAFGHQLPAIQDAEAV